MEKISADLVAVFVILFEMLMTIISYFFWGEKGFMIALGITIITLGLFIVMIGYYLVHTYTC